MSTSDRVTFGETRWITLAEGGADDCVIPVLELGVQIGEVRGQVHSALRNGDEWYIAINGRWVGESERYTYPNMKIAKRAAESFFMLKDFPESSALKLCEMERLVEHLTERIMTLEKRLKSLIGGES